MKLSRADNPERLIPVIPNDILLGLVWNCNISIEARVGPNGWEYLDIIFWNESDERYIGLRWTP